MKRISTLLFALTAMLTLPLTANAEDYVFDFQNNTLNLPVGEGASFTDGALTAPVTVGEVTLTSVQRCRLSCHHDEGQQGCHQPERV